MAITVECNLEFIQKIGKNVPQIEEFKMFSMNFDESQQKHVIDVCLIFMQNCEHLRKTVTGFYVKFDECHFNNYKWIYNKPDTFLNAYATKLKEKQLVLIGGNVQMNMK